MSIIFGRKKRYTPPPLNPSQPVSVASYVAQQVSKHNQEVQKAAEKARRRARVAAGRASTILTDLGEEEARRSRRTVLGG